MNVEGAEERERLKGRREVCPEGWKAQKNKEGGKRGDG